MCASELVADLSDCVSSVNVKVKDTQCFSCCNAVARQNANAVAGSNVWVEG